MRRGAYTSLPTCCPQATLEFFPLAGLSSESLQLGELWQQVLKKLLDPEQEGEQDGQRLAQVLGSQQSLRERLDDLATQVGWAGRPGWRAQKPRITGAVAAVLPGSMLQR